MRKKISPPAITEKDEQVSVRCPLMLTQKNCGRSLFSFSCFRSAKFRYTQIQQSSQTGEIDERLRLFPLAIVFLTPLFELKQRKRMIPIKLHELTTREALDVMISFKSHAIGRTISAFQCKSGAKSYSRSAKFKYMHIRQSRKRRQSST